MKKVILLVLLSACTSACSLVSEGRVGDNGRFLLMADSEGMRAYGDYVNGVITNGKASPDTDTPYYRLRTEQSRGTSNFAAETQRRAAQPVVVPGS